KVWAHQVIAPGGGGGSDHLTGLRVDLGETRTIPQESGCGALFGISAEAGGLRGEPATIGNQQNRGQDAAQAVGGERAVYLRAVWTRHRLTTLRTAAVPAWGKEGEEESCGRGSTEAGDLAASTWGDWRGL